MEYFVMSDSEENAIKALNKHLVKESDKPTPYYIKKTLPRKWGDKSFRNYTIDVYDVNQVVETEIA